MHSMTLETPVLYTVLCISVGPRPHGLETSVIIKISTHLCCPRTFTAFQGIKQKKNIYIYAKKNRWLKKSTFFKTVNSQYFFAKLSGIVHWNNRINWCEGHQCDSTDMVVRLSDIRPKTGKNAFFEFFCQF